MRVAFLAVTLLTIISLGCGPNPPTPVVSNPPATTPAPPSAIASAMQEAQKAAQATPPVAAPPSNAANTEQVPAQAGVGAKGRSLDPHEGFVVTPIKQLFRAKELAVFTIQVPQALQLYKANDPQGLGPKTHEDYMRDVIEENKIKLPELPPGHRYVYDPKTEELTVVRPKGPAPPALPGR